MEAPLTLIGDTARAWDEQHIDLASASRVVGGASTSGFTDAVAGSAAAFTTRWSSLISELAAGAESRADGLRATVEDYLTTDGEVRADLFLHGLHELR
jgi:hypothetical protein